MPVIISPDSENKWIDNTLSENQIKQYMHPYMSDLMQAYPIKNDFLKKVPTDPSILFPREENF